jgi:hypothetical protein
LNRRVKKKLKNRIKSPFEPVLGVFSDFSRFWTIFGQISSIF